MKYLVENPDCAVIAVFDTEEERKAWTEAHCEHYSGAWFFLERRIFWTEANGTEKYKITYDFKNERGACDEYELTNNGAGYDLEFARLWKSELISIGCKNVSIFEI